MNFFEQSSSHYLKRKIINACLCTTLLLSTTLALLPLLSIFGYVLSRGFPALNLSFFTELPKPVGEVGGGMANALVGTLMLISIASVIGIFFGMGTGLYLSEYGKGKLGHFIRFSVDVLSSVPSIVIGLFIYAIIVIPMGHFSAIAGGGALGLLMIPIIARSSEELLKLVPDHIRESGLALGIPRWKVIVRIVLRGNLSAVATGVILAVARVSGETAPLLFTALNNRFWTHRLDQPISSLPVQIYTYAISPYDDWQSQAWAGALVLVLFVFVVNLGSRFLLNPRQGKH